MEFVNIAGLKIANTTLEEAVDYALSMAKGEKNGNIVVTPNAEIAAKALDDKKFCEALNSAQLAVADGIGVVKAAKMLGTPVREKVAGVDLATKIIEKAPENNLSVYLLGGKPGVAKKAAENLKERYLGLNICGYSDGYFKEDAEVIDKVNASGADVVMCCLGAPKQEYFMTANREKFNAKLLMGVGGSIDVWAGTVKRAPRIFVKMNLEWLYRLIKQPSRIGRIMKIPGYLIKVRKYR